MWAGKGGKGRDLDDKKKRIRFGYEKKCVILPLRMVCKYGPLLCSLCCYLASIILVIVSCTALLPLCVGFLCQEGGGGALLGRRCCVLRSCTVVSGPCFTILRCFCW